MTFFLTVFFKSVEFSTKLKIENLLTHAVHQSIPTLACKKVLGILTHEDLVSDLEFKYTVIHHVRKTGEYNILMLRLHFKYSLQSVRKILRIVSFRMLCHFTHQTNRQ